MSSPDPLSIFLAAMTLISTLTGVVGTYVTFAQFKREAANREASERQNGNTPNSPSPNRSRFSQALKSKFMMSLGFIMLAIILGAVWKGTSSNLASALAPSHNSTTSIENAEEGTVNVNDTKEFHDGQIYISLNSTGSKGDPPRYFATFTVGAAEGKTQRIKGEEAGFTMDFQDFNIRVISVGATEAHFVVRKKAAG
ncbi:hypothetical protein EON80_16265 [bacterium]|nr:MAG: hypothetical protein EON80_16265 [bacterium]